MTIELKAQLRAKKEKLDKDSIPGIMYGKGVENKSLKLNKVDFSKAFSLAGESNLIDLDYGEKTVKVLIKDTQRHVMKNSFTHVDFYQVNVKEKISTEVPLNFIGESKAVKELGGVLNKEIDSIEVECLPGDLVDHIDVDISALAEINDAIRFDALKLPQGLSLVRQTNEVVIAVKEPNKEEIIETPVEETSTEEGTEEKSEDNTAKEGAGKGETKEGTENSGDKK